MFVVLIFQLEARGNHDRQEEVINHDRPACQPMMPNVSSIRTTSKTVSTEAKRFRFLGHLLILGLPDYYSVMSISPTTASIWDPSAFKNALGKL
jgi:hypothetical protein